MEVRFTHPRTSDNYLADVSALLTAKQAIDHLLSSPTGPFLSPLQAGELYELRLRRTGMIISPMMTMGNAGVIDQDVLDVSLAGQGA